MLIKKLQESNNVRINVEDKLTPEEYKKLLTRFEGTIHIFDEIKSVKRYTRKGNTIYVVCGCLEGGREAYVPLSKDGYSISYSSYDEYIIDNENDIIYLKVMGLNASYFYNFNEICKRPIGTESTSTLCYYNDGSISPIYFTSVGLCERANNLTTEQVLSIIKKFANGEYVHCCLCDDDAVNEFVNRKNETNGYFKISQIYGGFSFYKMHHLGQNKGKYDIIDGEWNVLYKNVVDDVMRWWCDDKVIGFYFKDYNDYFFLTDVEFNTLFEPMKIEEFYFYTNFLLLYSDISNNICSIYDTKHKKFVIKDIICSQKNIIKNPYLGSLHAGESKWNIELERIFQIRNDKGKVNLVSFDKCDLMFDEWVDAVYASYCYGKLPDDFISICEQKFKGAFIKANVPLYRILFYAYCLPCYNNGKIKIFNLATNKFLVGSNGEDDFDDITSFDNCVILPIQIKGSFKTDTCVLCKSDKGYSFFATDLLEDIKTPISDNLLGRKDKVSSVTFKDNTYLIIDNGKDVCVGNGDDAIKISGIKVIDDSYMLVKYTDGLYEPFDTTYKGKFISLTDDIKLKYVEYVYGDYPIGVREDGKKCFFTKNGSKKWYDDCSYNSLTGEIITK